MLPRSGGAQEGVYPAAARGDREGAGVIVRADVGLQCQDQGQEGEQDQRTLIRTVFIILDNAKMTDTGTNNLSHTNNDVNTSSCGTLPKAFVVYAGGKGTQL